MSRAGDASQEAPRFDGRTLLRRTGIVVATVAVDLAQRADSEPERPVAGARDEHVAV